MAKISDKLLKVLVSAVQNQASFGEAVYHANQDSIFIPPAELTLGKREVKPGLILHFVKPQSIPELAKAEFIVGWEADKGAPVERIALVRANGAYIFEGIAVRDTDFVKKGRRALLARASKPKVFKATE
jgi:hypothetical protein